MDETIYIAHHGIKGQKWGVRRFQNPDGTLTEAGRKRYSTGEADTKTGSGISKDTVKKVATTVVVAGSLAAAAYIYANNKPVIDQAVREAMTKVLVQSGTAVALADAKIGPVLDASIETGKKFVEQKIKEAGNIAGQKLKEGAKIASDKVIDAALSAAAVALIKQANDAFKDTDDMSEKQKATNKLMREIAEAEINNALKRNNGKLTTQQTNEILNKTRNLDAYVGHPKGMMGAEDEKAYQALFQRKPTDDQRAIIKAMRKNGYAPDQIEKYVFS